MCAPGEPPASAGSSLETYTTYKYTVMFCDFPSVWCNSTVLFLSFVHIYILTTVATMTTKIFY